MKEQEIQVGFRNKKIKINVKKVSRVGKSIGLMFSSRKRAKALLFGFKNPKKTSIHSFFVFFSFLAVWLDKKNKVVDLKRVSPFRFHVSSRKSYSRLLEIPFNNRYKRILKILVGGKDLKRL